MFPFACSREARKFDWQVRARGLELYLAIDDQFGNIELKPFGNLAQPMPCAQIRNVEDDDELFAVRRQQRLPLGIESGKEECRFVLRVLGRDEMRQLAALATIVEQIDLLFQHADVDIEQTANGVFDFT